MLSKASIGLASAFAMLGALGATGPAWAGSKIFSSGSTVLTVNGTLETNASQNRDPFVAQVFTTGAECLRIAVVSQGQDLEAQGHHRRARLVPAHPVAMGRRIGELGLHHDRAAGRCHQHPVLAGHDPARRRHRGRGVQVRQQRPEARTLLDLRVCQ